MNTIDIDIGGTFTDCYVSLGGRTVAAKALTTGYDLSQGFLLAVEDAARQFGLTLEDLLAQTEALRYSTTLALNKLIERKGPRLALVTTRGFEDIVFIGKGSQWQDGLVVREKRRLALVSKPEPLIPRELVIGVRERVDSMGRVVMPLDEEEFRGELHRLMDQGVQGIAVCLLWAHLNPAHERRIREIVEEEYPDFYLGSVPVVLSHEVLPKRDEYPRAMTTILNAYLHRAMAEELSGIYDRLRQSRYVRPIQMVHNTGGMGDLFSTTAIQTFNSGPVAGLMGSAFVARQYGFPNVIVTDMGGTSFDLGLIVEGSTRFYRFQPVVHRWLVGTTLLETQSIGAGGGSIGWIHPMLRRLEVGPQSAGSMPGPACYNLGGEEPTVTDANLVLGYLNPHFYFGGRMRLDRSLAEEAIRERVARPLGLEVEEAALMIKKVVDANMGNAIFKETALRGFDPREFVLFAYGGAGPTHACGYAQYVNPQRIVVAANSAVFCAFGSSTLDLVRFYEQSRHLILRRPGTQEIVLDREEFNKVVRGLQERALRDLRIEGFRPGDVLFQLELDIRFSAQIHTLRMSSPRVLVAEEADARAIEERFLADYAEVFSPVGVFSGAGLDIENFVLKAIVAQPKTPLPRFPAVGTPSRLALKETRPVLWEEEGDFRETPIYDRGKLQSGHVLEGPAVVEDLHTTIVVSPGRRFRVDEYGNGLIEEA